MRHHYILLAATMAAAAYGAAIAADSGRSRTYDVFEYRRLKLHDPSPLDTVAAIGGEEGEYLRYLYAYMPLGDIGRHPVEFFRRNVAATLRARGEMPWGGKVPLREFLHFVLPLRINNEALDSLRTVIYPELSRRVAGMSMEKAILEVNHWCHEHVTYRPSDARTSSPLSTLSQAYGRCGEESTLTVAALRSVGIPARQVYTPRWAHTDDNHAWVEAWADGEWHFLGACEPEPVLDLAWFNQPAGRAMLLHTKAFGEYDGPEDVLDSSTEFTEINLTPYYVPVDTLDVTVTDTAGRPVEGATVDFRIFNYCEFHPVHTARSDRDGHARLIAGRGDMLVTATDGQRFGIQPAHPGIPLAIRLDLDSTSQFVRDIDITPPFNDGRQPAVDTGRREACYRRIAAGDSIRQAYTSTFPTPQSATAIMDSIWPDTDCGLRQRAAAQLQMSAGNCRPLTRFLATIPDSLRRRAVMLMETIEVKDLRDTDADVLADNLYHTVAQKSLPDSTYCEWLLTPRVGTEPLVAYKQQFSRLFSPGVKEALAADARPLESLAAALIKVDDASNPQHIPMTPIAAQRQRAGDATDRATLFVALARSLGIPARTDPVTGNTLYMTADGTVRQAFARDINRSDTCLLTFSYQPDILLPDPEYYRHFTLSDIRAGRPELLEYADGTTASRFNGGDATTGSGQKLLVTGRRMADGSVLARLTLFHVHPDGNDTVPLTLRADSTRLSVIGSFDSGSMYQPVSYDDNGTLHTDGNRRSILSATGRGFYALGLIRAGHEPSVHTLNDIAAAAKELDQTGRPLLLLFADRRQAENFNPALYAGLPQCVSYGIDTDGSIARALADTLHTGGEPPAPLFVIADTFNRVVLSAGGYTIGLGHRLADALRTL